MQIGSQLRSLYNALLGEAVPDELLDLLRQAEAHPPHLRSTTD